MQPRCSLIATALYRLAGIRRFGQTVTSRAKVQRSIKSKEILASESAQPSSRVYLISKNREEEAYPLSEALRALRAYSLSEIPETVELSVKVNLMLKKNKVRDAFRGTLIYPHRFGDQRKILLLADDVSVDEIANSGADIVGGPDYIKKLESGAVSLSSFDVCVCTVGMYDKIKPLQKKLRAKMPNPRRGTVAEPSDILQVVLENQQSRQYKSDKKGYVNMPVGKLDFPDEHLQKNIQHLIDEIVSQRGTLPTASFIERTILSTTYGPGFLLITKDYL